MGKENTLTGFRKLIVYQKSKNLVLLIYKVTKTFPKEELFGLVSQMRRASVSITANVVEGYSKNSSKEYNRYLTISIGSITELEFLLEISKELGFIESKTFDNISNELYIVKKMLYGTRKKIAENI